MNDINTFLFYTWNCRIVRYSYDWNSTISVYVPEVIVKAPWGTSRDHMVDKWREAENRSDAYGRFSVFYANLDAANRAIMLNWIIKNYKDAPALK